MQVSICFEAPVIWRTQPNGLARKFLIDTLLHEYYETEIMKRQYADGFYKKLDRAGDAKRHKWINEQIEIFFKEMEGKK